MTAKLQINMSEGLISVEGEEKFVQAIYDDFRDRIIEMNRGRGSARTNDIALPHTEAPVIVPEEKTSKPAKSAKSKGTSSSYKPQFNPDLNLGKLAEFYAQFTPKNHSEKILLFAIFLRDHLKKTPCTADDIYSCYFTLKSKTEIPEAFMQAFITAWNRTKWVQLISKDDLKITTAGENHFSEMTKATNVNG